MNVRRIARRLVVSCGIWATAAAGLITWAGLKEHRAKTYSSRQPEPGWPLWLERDA